MINLPAVSYGKLYGAIQSTREVIEGGVHRTCPHCREVFQDVQCEFLILS